MATFASFLASWTERKLVSVVWQTYSSRCLDRWCSLRSSDPVLVLFASDDLDEDDDSNEEEAAAAAEAPASSGPPWLWLLLQALLATWA